MALSHPVNIHTPTNFGVVRFRTPNALVMRKYTYSSLTISSWEWRVGNDESRAQLSPVTSAPFQVFTLQLV